jgi:hypothetical protein
MYCHNAINFAELCKILNSVPQLMRKPFKPGSSNTIFFIQFTFDENKLSVIATNCIGDKIKFSVQLFAPDTSQETSQRWLIRYLEESFDRSTSFIIKRHFVRLLGDLGIVLRNSRDNSFVVTDVPHMASPTLLHGSGIYFPQLDQDGVDNLVSTIHDPQALTTLIRLSALQYNHSALLAPSDTIPLLDALIAQIQPGSVNKKKALIIITNFAACEETRPILVGMTLLDSLVACLQDDLTIKTLLGFIFEYLRSTNSANLEPYIEQLQAL